MIKRKRNVYLCKCGCNFKLTEADVERVWEAHGYDFEGYVYYIKCPRCKLKQKVNASKLPFKILFSLIKRK